jgi:transcriptional regulator with XRE-family HTH domain
MTKLDKLIKKTNLSEYALAEKIKIPRGTIQKWRKSKRIELIIDIYELLKKLTNEK